MYIVWHKPAVLLIINTLSVTYFIIVERFMAIFEILISANDKLWNQLFIFRKLIRMYA